MGDDALKKRLLNRIVVAVVIVTGLLGSLAVFDFLNAPPSPPSQVEAPTPSLPPMAASMKSKESEPASTQSEKPSESTPPTVEQGVPEESAAPTTPMQAMPSEKPLTKPATGRLAMLHRAEPSATEPAESRLLSNKSQPKPESHSASRPVNRATGKQFGLQLGVFSNLENAEDLRANLEKHGIPATIEARVHAGPFASRAEADAARIKLKELGISESLMIMLKNRVGR
ncbi:MAG: SPOR domain-containing protein [Sulfuritalea sp.]|nr:SPOR domain-containing protein [Sulfuritalea sp.]